MERLYVSNKDESVPMFRRRWMDVFSRVHPAVPHLLYVPMVGFFFYLSWRARIPVEYVVSLFALGLFLWTFAEYILHRFVFHFHTKTEFGRRVWFIIHGVHHDYPRDSRRLVMPPAVSLPLCALFYGIFRLCFGPEYMFAPFAGFIVGYLSYDTLHFASHHWTLKGRWALYLQHQHLRHHYQDPDRNFGVSSPIWDFVFGTYSRRRKDREEAAEGAAESAGR